MSKHVNKHEGATKNKIYIHIIIYYKRIRFVQKQLFLNSFIKMLSEKSVIKNKKLLNVSKVRTITLETLFQLDTFSLENFSSAEIITYHIDRILLFI